MAEADGAINRILESSGAVPWQTARLMVRGEGGVGKSSTIRVRGQLGGRQLGGG